MQSHLLLEAIIFSNITYVQKVKFQLEVQIIILNNKWEVWDKLTNFCVCISTMYVVTKQKMISLLSTLVLKLMCIINLSDVCLTLCDFYLFLLFTKISEKFIRLVLKSVAITKIINRTPFTFWQKNYIKIYRLWFISLLQCHATHVLFFNVIVEIFSLRLYFVFPPLILF